MKKYFDKCTRTLEELPGIDGAFWWNCRPPSRAYMPILHHWGTVLTKSSKRTIWSVGIGSHSISSQSSTRILLLNEERTM